MNADKYNYLFVSDLHIAQGVDPEKKTYHPREDFLYDHEFFRFLIWTDKNQNKKKWELVFNGDCFDFLPIETNLLDYQQYNEYKELNKQYQKWKKTGWVDEDWGKTQDQWYASDGWMQPLLEEELGRKSTGGGGKTNQQEDPIDTWQKRHGFLPTEGVSLSRLRLIFRGHPVFFQALAWWIGRGHRLVMIPGNHDQDLVWKRVQEEFGEILYGEYAFLRDGIENPFIENVHKFRESFAPVDSRMTKARFLENIDFSHQWFYYKPGVFYAEHGHQYEFGNSINNLITPWVATTYEKQPGKESKGKIKVLNYPIGSLIVEALVGPLEDAYPQWENTSSLGSYVGNLFKSKPIFMFGFLWSKGGKFWNMLKEIESMSESRDGNSNFPPNEELEYYAKKEGLPASIGPRLYDNWARPILSYRKLSAALLGPGRHFWFVFATVIGIALAALIIWLSFGVISPLLTDLGAFITYKIIDPEQARDNYKDFTIRAELWWEMGAIRYLIGFLGLYGLIMGIKDYALKFISWILNDYISDETKKLIKRYVMPSEYIKSACQRIHAIMRSTLQPCEAPYYYIMGHDHLPNFFVIEDTTRDRDQQTFYVNAGSWLPSFAGEGIRRMRTSGSDSEFTFFMITTEESKYGSTCFGELLRWNDDAGRVQPQITQPLEIDSKEEKGVERRILNKSKTPLKWSVDEILGEYKVGDRVEQEFRHLEKNIEKHWGVVDIYTRDSSDAIFPRKVEQETRYLAGIQQWIVEYWAMDSGKLFCQVQLKPVQKTWVHTARFPTTKTENKPNSFWVSIPISARLGRSISAISGVSQAMKHTVNTALKTSPKYGFIPLEIANREDNDSILDILKVIAQSMKLEENESAAKKVHSPV